MTRVFLFSGQGSQKKGMGAELFGRYPRLVEQADAVLGYSVAELCLEDPGGRLRDTQFTQPALYVTNTLAYLRKVEELGAGPEAVAGHSLGELCALQAAGAFDFLTGLQIVKRRAELMAEVRGGGMAAVIGLRAEEVGRVLHKAGLEAVDIANFNTPIQTIIAGSQEDLRQAERVFEQAGAAFTLLEVSAPFHSRYMRPAAERFGELLSRLPLAPPQIPVLSNYSAQPYQPGEVIDNLVKQLAHPVRWFESIYHLLGLPAPTFTEIGPGAVLTKMLGSIEREYRKRQPPPSPPPSPPASSPASPSVAPPVSIEAPRAAPRISAERLGSESFKVEHGTRLAYVAGAMGRGISSEKLVIRMAEAGLLAYFGTAGLPLARVEAAIESLTRRLAPSAPFGMSLPGDRAEMEEALVELFLRHGVRRIEIAGFLQVTPALVRYRLKGAGVNGDGSLYVPNKILAKITRPEAAEKYLSPPPERIVQSLLAAGQLTREEAQLAARMPMADDLCAISDAAGPSEKLAAATLIPAIVRMRDEAQPRFRTQHPIRVGAGGGIGTPHAIAAALILGADFVLTGSINQCTVEAGTSDAAKDLLAQAGIDDTELAPAAELLEQGARVQVLARGLFFPARAGKLYELFREHRAISALDDKSRALLEKKLFRCPLAVALEQARAHFQERAPQLVNEAEGDRELALLLRFYLDRGMELAIHGGADQVDYQIYCGPAMGAFNQWARGTKLEDPRSRHVDEIAQLLMREAAQLLQRRYAHLHGERP